MTYAGGSYPSVSGHPPHLARQYLLLASENRITASVSMGLWPLIGTTLGGGVSARIARNSFPRLQDFQYGLAFGLGVAALRDAPLRQTYTERPKADAGKRNRQRQDEFAVRQSAVYAAEVFNFSPISRPDPKAGAIGLGEGVDARTGAAPQVRKTGPLQPRSLCPLPEGLRQTSALSRRSRGLHQRLPFQPHGSGFVLHTRDLRPVAKLYVDHVAQGRLSKSGEPVRPALVSL